VSVMNAGEGSFLEFFASYGLFGVHLSLGCRRLRSYDDCRAITPLFCSLRAGCYFDARTRICAPPARGCPR